MRILLGFVYSSCLFAITFSAACSSTKASDASGATPETSASAPSPIATPVASGTPSASASTPPPPPSADAGSGDAGPPTPPTIDSCFGNLKGAVAGPDYDQFHPVVGKTCAGTQHQKISGVERLVFLGDSITTGTPPNLPTQYYRALVTNGIKQRFGNNVDVQDCSAWGARTDDFLDGKNQIASCFPTGVETKKTLIVMTMGGNDINNWAQHQFDVPSAIAAADAAAQLQRDAVLWLKDPAHFPNGSYVVFSNVYEYTDTTGDLFSCPAAIVAGGPKDWKLGVPVVVHFQEQLMKIAVDTQTDIVFLLETFCGHGYHRGDVSGQCYRGPNAPLWFDLSCLHPNPEGHGVIAKMMLDVVDG